MTYNEQSHVVRDLKRRLRIANKTMGRQGQTIAALRGELARAREETSKIDRGELRRLERFEASAIEQFAIVNTKKQQLSDEIKQLRERLERYEGSQG